MDIINVYLLSSFYHMAAEFWGKLRGLLFPRNRSILAFFFLHLYAWAEIIINLNV